MGFPRDHEVYLRNKSNGRLVARLYRHKGKLIYSAAKPVLGIIKTTQVLGKWGKPSKITGTGDAV